MLETINHGNVRELRLARPPANALSADLVELITRSLIKAHVFSRPGCTATVAV